MLFSGCECSVTVLLVLCGELVAKVWNLVFFSFFFFSGIRFFFFFFYEFEDVRVEMINYEAWIQTPDTTGTS